MHQGDERDVMHRGVARRVSGTGKREATRLDADADWGKKSGIVCGP